MRYRLRGFENDGLGDIPLGETTIEAHDRQQAVLMGIAHWTGNPVGACCTKRMWVHVDELWDNTEVDPIEYHILETLRDHGTLTLDALETLTRRLPHHVREALQTLERKGLVHKGAGFTYTLAPDKETTPCSP